MNSLTRREFLAGINAGATLALLPRQLLSAEPGRRPNVIIILTDDMGSADCGAYGAKEIRTPHIDALAKGGARFRNAYSAGPVCSPSRASLVTGRYQARFGMDANAEGGPNPADKGPRALDLGQTTIAQAFSAAGYATGLIGKWHLGHQPGYRPNDRGFAHFYGLHPYGIAGKEPDGSSAACWRNDQKVESPANHMRAFGNDALEFIDRHREKPFLLYLAFTATHAPYVSAPDDLKTVAPTVPKNRRAYVADLQGMDRIIGEIMRRVKERGLDNDTLVFFCSDNGGSGGAAHNGALSGTKWTLWEGGIRVPYIVRWPGRIPAGQILDQLAIHTDVMPTALAAAGIAAKPEWKLDGANLLPLLDNTNRAEPHSALYWRFGVQYAVRQGNWKLVKPHIDMQPRLFNLANDIGEKHDLAAKHPERVKELQALWDQWNAGNEPPRWIDNRWNGDGPRPKAKPTPKTRP